MQIKLNITNIYLRRKVVCFVGMRSTEPRCFRLCSWCLSKLSTRRSAWDWFHKVWTCSAKVFEYWMISWLKIKLNHSWKFRRNWNVPLVLLERSWWAGFNGIYLIRFGFRMWKILIFKCFLPLKIQINSKNQVLEGKISWERGNTWQAWYPFIFGCLKNQYMCCKTMFTCWVSLFCNRITLGPIVQATLVIY